MTTENFPLHDEEVLDRVRDLVRALIENKVAAPAISYSLSYIAAEFGFHAADDGRKVISVVLSAISRATAAEITEEPDVTAPAEADLTAPAEVCEQCAPKGATVH